MIKRISYSKINALSLCDIINKYSLTNVNNAPNLKHLKVSLFSEANLTTEKKDVIKIKEFLFLYFFSSNLPLIKYHFKSKDKKELSKVNSEDLKLTFITSRKKVIYNLLISIFIENYSRLMNKNNFYNYEVFQTKSFTKLTLLVPLKNLFDLEYLFSSETAMAYRESIISFSFFFDTLDEKQQKNLKNSFKLLPFFNLL